MRAPERVILFVPVSRREATSNSDSRSGLPISFSKSPGRNSPPPPVFLTRLFPWRLCRIWSSLVCLALPAGSCFLFQRSARYMSSPTQGFLLTSLPRRPWLDIGSLPWRDDSGPQRNWMELVEPAQKPSSCFLSFGHDWWLVSVTPSVHLQKLWLLAQEPFLFLLCLFKFFFQSSARGSSLLEETWPPSPALLSLLPHLTLLLPLSLGSWMCSSLHRTRGSEPRSPLPPSCLGVFHPSHRSKWWWQEPRPGILDHHNVLLCYLFDCF